MENEVIQYFERSLAPFNGRTQEDYLKLLKSKLTGRVEEAFLFGSTARGEQTQNSDVDLLIITDSKLPFVERFKDFFDLFELSNGLELLVYTKEEFKKLENSSGFWREFEKDKIKIL